MNNRDRQVVSIPFRAPHQWPNTFYKERWHTVFSHLARARGAPLTTAEVDGMDASLPRLRGRRHRAKRTVPKDRGERVRLIRDP